MGGGLAFRRWFGHCQCLKVNYLFQLMSSVITPNPIIEQRRPIFQSRCWRNVTTPWCDSKWPQNHSREASECSHRRRKFIYFDNLFGELGLRSSLPTYVGRFGGCMSIYGQAAPEPPSDKHYSVSMSRKLSIRKSLDTHFLPVCQRYCLWTTNSN